jgi:hypothetical protein
MSHEGKFLAGSEMIAESVDVLKENGSRIGVEIARLVGEIVAAKVGSYDEMILAEFAELVFPGVGELGKTMEKKDQ